MKYTKHNLKKIQDLLEEVGYTVRYEKGNFQSGYCLVETKRVAVVNRFYDTEGRMNVMLDILSKVDIDFETMSPDSLKLYHKLIVSPGKEVQEKENEESKNEEIPQEEPNNEENISV